MFGGVGLAGQSPQDEGKSQPKVCNVCHLPYEGEECPWCKAEREHASGVIEERGRRSRRLKEEAESRNRR
jgi:hypothetical protein